MSTYAIILAGGSGRRFWPLSRDSRPKQLLQILSERTLLEQAIARLHGVVSPEHIIILTNKYQLLGIQEVSRKYISESQVIAEPIKRDTAPSIALGIGWIMAKDPNATIITIPADHLIQDEIAFRECLQNAVKAAEETASLVTIGIKPTWACPSYGYIERGEIVETEHTSCDVYKVACFREKPNPELAEEFLRKGNFNWNAGMFVWSIPVVKRELDTHCPELSSFVELVSKNIDNFSAISDAFHHLTAISIDYALMEKSNRVVNIEATFDWDDVGNWSSVAKYLPTDTASNASNSPLSTMDADGSIVYTSAKKHVTLLDVHDLIIVETEDALLVANKHSADTIKKLVDLVPKDLH